MVLRSHSLPKLMDASAGHWIKTQLPDPAPDFPHLLRAGEADGQSPQVTVKPQAHGPRCSFLPSLPYPAIATAELGLDGARMERPP